MKPSKLASIAVDVMRVQMGLAPQKALQTSVHLNTHCNLRCSYCFIAVNPNYPTGYKESGLSLEKMKVVLKNLSGATHNVIFTGGETFLYKGFSELLDYARGELGFNSLSAISNGMFLESKPEVLSRLDHVAVSYDLMRRNQYPEILDKVLQSIVKLRKTETIKQGQIYFNCTIAEHEMLSDWSEFFDLVAKSGFQIFVQPVRDGFGNLESWDAFNQMVAEIRRVYGANMFINCKTYLGEYDHKLTKKLCHPKARMYVDVWGNLVYPCERFANSNLGTLTEPDFPITKKWAEAEAREKFPSSKCEKCAYNCVFGNSIPYRRPLQTLVTSISARLH
jgi:MoaA/NifB/PqqE/SkfB family radical SAM enzyme